MTTAKIAYDVKDNSGNDYDVANAASTAKIGDTLTFTVTAATAGEAANGKAVKLNGVKVGELADGAAEVPAKYEFVQVATDADSFAAIKGGAGAVYTKGADGTYTLKETWTDGTDSNVALYKMTADEVAAVAATASVSAVITDAMLENNTEIVITVE